MNPVVPVVVGSRAESCYPFAHTPIARVCKTRSRVNRLQSMPADHLLRGFEFFRSLEGSIDKSHTCKSYRFLRSPSAHREEWQCSHAEIPSESAATFLRSVAEYSWVCPLPQNLSFLG